MEARKGLFAGKGEILLAGAVIGLCAVLLQYAGNPANMGVCVACFLRDMAGALGLHRAAPVQYLRPEIPAFVLGSLAAALLGGEFRSRAGSAPVLRFFLGMSAMAGALVFLGCPWRVLLRLAGGDGNALFGLAGLLSGIYLGHRFAKSGFALPASQAQSTFSGLMLPLVAAGLLAARLFLSPDPATGSLGWLWSSVKGPGAAHAPLLASLGGGLLIGVLAQRSRFCTVGSLRELFTRRQMHLIYGVAMFLLAALVGNLVLGQFHPGFEGQPVAHTASLWNYLGMLVAGLAFSLAGGCPGRQLILAGEGSGDAASFVLGMLTAGALAHNMGWASSPAGPGPNALAVVVVSLGFCLAVGFWHRKAA
ncbi:MAG: YedE-related selenium metabolism membrane protein [Proteobacteria bacterium]|nr:YedE-related selenium metabolism membrane protein [Pseudomonadota bacterium]MBU1594111.1 YedE-related selenium metabolism membrane protein [Pseudomonadota bacterium]